MNIRWRYTLASILEGARSVRMAPPSGGYLKQSNELIEAAKKRAKDTGETETIALKLTAFERLFGSLLFTSVICSLIATTITLSVRDNKYWVVPILVVIVVHALVNWWNPAED